MHAERSHEITVALPPQQAISLFTPKGEEAWVPDWSPTYLAPADGETCEGMLFATGSDVEKTFWTCMKLDMDNLLVRYFRLTPASRATFVTVQCRAAGPDSSTVRVGYAFHALTDSGRDYVSSMTPEAFARMIGEWEVLIARHLGF